VASWRGGATNLGRADVHHPDRVDDADATGYEEAQYLDACVADVREWLGGELTAYLTGADSPAELSRWLSGRDAAGPTGTALAHSALTDAALGGAGRRLQTASEVVEIFAAAGQGTRARAWLREVSPLTGGRSPADLVRHARTDRLLDQVREAAERHVLATPPA
jgi:hypothetical protein